MWAPMPAAVPLTAAMTGFSQSRIDGDRAAARRRGSSRPTSPSGALGRARRARGSGGCGGAAGRRRCRSRLPLAVSTTARTSRSALASSSSSITRLRWSGVMALCASGRLSVIQRRRLVDAVQDLLVEGEFGGWRGHGEAPQGGAAGGSVGGDLTGRQIRSGSTRRAKVRRSTFCMAVSGISSTSTSCSGSLWWARRPWRGRAGRRASGATRGIGRHHDGHPDLAEQVVAAGSRRCPRPLGARRARRPPRRGTRCSRHG